MRPSPAEELPRPGPVLSASFASRPVSCHAGTNAAKSPAATEIAVVKISTRASTAMSPMLGSALLNEASRMSTPKYAAANPTSPPPMPSTSPSVSSCCTTRKRLAPSAFLTAISFARPCVRTSIRLARFAHAISSTRATAPSSTSSEVRTSPIMSSCSGRTSAPQPLLSSGYCSASRSEIASRSACACLTSTPVFSLATPR